MTRLAAILVLLAICLSAYGNPQQETMMHKVWGARTVAAPSGPGNAVDLDGSSEYLSDATTSLLSGATQVTILAWSIQRAATTVPPLLANRDSTFNGLTIDNATKKMRFYVNSVASGFAPDNSATTGVWHLAVGTWEKSATITPMLYYDGVGYAGTAQNANIADNDVWRIGYDDVDPARKFSGIIDEVAIFKNRVLSTNEVIELWANGAGKPVQQLSTGTAGLVRLWHLDESGAASNAVDSASGTTATGTAIGTGDWVTGKVPQ